MKLSSIGRGVTAGLAATIVLSAIMLLKQAMGFMPELDPIAMITSMMGGGSLAIGWIGHFAIGAMLWGTGFAVVSPYLPGPQALRGVLFASAAWLMMMIVVMPMAEAGMFGLRLGMGVPVATLMPHVVFGMVLGAVYGLTGRQTIAAGYSR
jgi:hypothetical protein